MSKSLKNPLKTQQIRKVLAARLLRSYGRLILNIFQKQG